MGYGQSCSDIYQLSGDHNTCGPVANCQTYSSGVCQSCTGTYELSGDKKTCGTIAHCQTYTDQVCQSCDDSYYPSQDKTSCIVYSPALSAQDIAEVSTISASTTAAATATKTTIAVINALSATNPVAVTSGSLMKILEYTRYINIAYPPQLNLTYDLYKPQMSLFSIQKLRLTAPHKKPPEKTVPAICL